MKKLVKIVLCMLVALVVIAIVGVGYIKFMLPNVGPASDIQVGITKEAIERGDYLAGGFEFNFPDGSVLRSTNITPHNATGIGLWNEGFFVNRFKSYTDSAYVPEPVNPGEFQSAMPWIMYGGMDEDDLKAIYVYLRSVPKVENMVERFTFAVNQ